MMAQLEHRTGDVRLHHLRRNAETIRDFFLAQRLETMQKEYVATLRRQACDRVSQYAQALPGLRDTRRIGHHIRQGILMILNRLQCWTSMFRTQQIDSQIARRPEQKTARVVYWSHLRSQQQFQEYILSGLPPRFRTTEPTGQISFYRTEMLSIKHR